MANPNLLLISGSLRQGSVNRKLLAEASRSFGTARVVVADLDLPLYNRDDESSTGIPEKVELLADQISKADAVVISTPEYNQSLSGVLKNALDWVSRVKGNPWQDKPVAILSAAAGRTGGARAQYSLRLAMNPFRPRLLTGPELLLAGAAGEIEEDGRLTSQKYLATLKTLMQKLRDEITSA